MSEFLNAISEWVQEVIRTLGYPGITIVMFLEMVFPPIPSEVIMPFAGFLAGRGEMNIFLVILAGNIGTITSAIVLYYIGAWAGEPVVRRFVKKYGRFMMVSEKDLDRTLNIFDKRGELVIFFGRLIPLIRTFVSLPAGMNRMSMKKFVLYTTIGSTVWNTFLGVGGMILGENWEDLMELVDRYSKVTYAIIGVVLIILFFIRLRSYLQNRNANAATPTTSAVADSE